MLNKKYYETLSNLSKIKKYLSKRDIVIYKENKNEIQEIENLLYEYGIGHEDIETINNIIYMINANQDEYLEKEKEIRKDIRKVKRFVEGEDFIFKIDEMDKVVEFEELLNKYGAEYQSKNYRTYILFTDL